MLWLQFLKGPLGPKRAFLSPKYTIRGIILLFLEY